MSRITPSSRADFAARLRGLARLELPGRWLGVALLLAYVAIVALYLASGLDMEAWDDSYFFKRIGLNILHHGSVAWNVEDGPVYGNTSQGFQVVSVVALLLGADYYITIIKLVSALSLLLMFTVYLRAARRSVLASAPSDLALAWGTGFLAASAPFVLLLIHSGMETCVALAVLAVNLVTIQAGTSTRRQTFLVVITTVLVYLTRPDAVVISLVAITVNGWSRDGKPPVRMMAWCGLSLLAVLGVCYLYFGTPFPLAFYLKTRTLTIYSPQFVAMDLVIKRRNLAGLLVLAAPLCYVVAHSRSRWSWALAASSVTFVAYHYFFTVEVMAYYARFYVPGLVPLALAAIDSAPRLRERSRPLVTLLFATAYLLAVALMYRQRLIYNDGDALHTRVDAQLYAGYAVAAVILLVGARLHAQLAAFLMIISLVLGSALGLPRPALALHSDEALLQQHIDRFTTVRGIRAIRACIDEPFQLYHTEIGVPGVLFPRSTITDMAGLMDRQFARGDRNFDARCMHDRPAVIFLPHRNYKAQREGILAGECIRDYRRVVSDSSSPLYIRTDLVDDFLACARTVHDPWIDAR